MPRGHRTPAHTTTRPHTTTHHHSPYTLFTSIVYTPDISSAVVLLIGASSLLRALVLLLGASSLSMCAVALFLGASSLPVRLFCLVVPPKGSYADELFLFAHELFSLARELF